MADNRSYSCSPACFSWWQNNIVGVLQKGGATNVDCSNGRSGTVSFDVHIGPSSVHLRLGYGYDGSSQAKVTVEKSPFWLPNSTVLDYIGNNIGQCGC